MKREDKPPRMTGASSTKEADLKVCGLRAQALTGHVDTLVRRLITPIQISLGIAGFFSLLTKFLRTSPNYFYYY